MLTLRRRIFVFFAVNRSRYVHIGLASTPLCLWPYSSALQPPPFVPSYALQSRGLIFDELVTLTSPGLFRLSVSPWYDEINPTMSTHRVVSPVL